MESLVFCQHVWCIAFAVCFAGGYSTVRCHRVRLGSLSTKWMGRKIISQQENPPSYLIKHVFAYCLGNDIRFSSWWANMRSAQRNHADGHSWIRNICSNFFQQETLVASKVIFKSLWVLFGYLITEMQPWIQNTESFDSWSKQHYQLQESLKSLVNSE